MKKNVNFLPHLNGVVIEDEAVPLLWRKPYEKN